jgi:signal recognition particle GTPase
MVTLIARHSVQDFKAWKRVADAGGSDSERIAQWGIGESHMYRTADGSGVIVTHEFNDLESAQAYKKMMESAEGKAMLKQTGAKLPLTLTIWIGEEI